MFTLEDRAQPERPQAPTDKRPPVARRTRDKDMAEPPQGITHGDLVDLGGAWLRGAARCPIVLTELVAITAETPDAIGWRHSAGESFLLECKVSRRDFLADRRKGFRVDAACGMGMFRYYLCPPGVIRVEDLPDRWGLLYCRGQRIELVHGRDPRAYDMEARDGFVHKERNVVAELRMFYSALARLKKDLGDRRFHERINLPYNGRNRKLPRGAQPA